MKLLKPKRIWVSREIHNGEQVDLYKISSCRPIKLKCKDGYKCCTLFKVSRGLGVVECAEYFEVFTNLHLKGGECVRVTLAFGAL